MAIETTFTLTITCPYGTADLIQSTLYHTAKELAKQVAEYGHEDAILIDLDSDKGEHIEFREVSTCAG